jgi:hypothetical protein
MLRTRSVTNGAQRLAGLLLNLPGRHGTRADGAIEVAMALSQEELASLVGASRATVTRALSDWRNRGLILTGQRRITITDPRGLREVAGPAIRETDTAASARALGVATALSRPDTSQPTLTSALLSEASQPSVPSSERVLSAEIAVRLGAWEAEDHKGTDFMVFSRNAA